MGRQRGQWFVFFRLNIHWLALLLDNQCKPTCSFFLVTSGYALDFAARLHLFNDLDLVLLWLQTVEPEKAQCSSDDRREQDAGSVKQSLLCVTEPLQLRFLSDWILGSGLWSGICFDWNPAVECSAQNAVNV